MTIGQRIKELANSRGLTNYMISSETGISESTLGRIIKDKTTKPGLSTVRKLANYFDVSEHWLRTGTEVLTVNEKTETYQSSNKNQKTENEMDLSQRLSYLERIIDAQQITIKQMSERISELYSLQGRDIKKKESNTG